MEAELGRFPRGREGKYPRAENRWRPWPLWEGWNWEAAEGMESKPLPSILEAAWTITPFLPQTGTERPRDRHSSFTGPPGTKNSKGV